MYLVPFSELSQQEQARLCTVLMDHFKVPDDPEKRSRRQDALAERFALMAFGDPTVNATILSLSDAISHYFHGAAGDREDVAVSAFDIQKVTGADFSEIRSALVIAGFSQRNTHHWERSPGAMITKVPAEEFEFVPNSKPMMQALKEAA